MAMAGKYTEFEKQRNENLRIVLLGETKEDVQDIASSELDADSKFAEVIEWQLANGWTMLRAEDTGPISAKLTKRYDMPYNWG